MGYSEPTRWRDYDKKFNDFGYKEVAGQIAITAYWGHDENVEIPSTIDGKSVTMISESAFSRNHSITGVLIPDGVTSIGDQAFYRCFQLVIHCPKDSFANSYAVENEIEYVLEG